MDGYQVVRIEDVLIDIAGLMAISGIKHRTIKPQAEYLGLDDAGPHKPDHYRF